MSELLLLQIISILYFMPLHKMYSFGLEEFAYIKWHLES